MYLHKYILPGSFETYFDQLLMIWSMKHYYKKLNDSFIHVEIKKQSRVWFVKKVDVKYLKLLIVDFECKALEAKLVNC
mgnify:CR=1 FL=1